MRGRQMSSRGEMRRKDTENSKKTLRRCEDGALRVEVKGATVFESALFMEFQPYPPRYYSYACIVTADIFKTAHNCHSPYLNSRAWGRVGDNIS